MTKKQKALARQIVIRDEAILAVQADINRIKMSLRHSKHLLDALSVSADNRDLLGTIAFVRQTAWALERLSLNQKLDNRDDEKPHYHLLADKAAARRVMASLGRMNAERNPV